MNALRADPDSELVYESGGSIYMLDTHTGKTTLLVSEDDIRMTKPAFATSSRIVPGEFSTLPGNKDLYFKLIQDQHGRGGEHLFIYNFARKTIDHVVDVWEGWVRDRSPDGRYLATYFSTCPCGGALTIFDLNNENKIVHAGGFGYISPSWTHVAFNKIEIPINVAVSGEVGMSSLYAQSTASTSSIPIRLLEATNLISYELVGWFSDEEVLYVQSVLSEPLDPEVDIYGSGELSEKYLKIYSSPITSTWKINIRTGEKIQGSGTIQQEDMSEWKKSENPYSKELQAYQYSSPRGKWKVVVTTQWPEGEIYLMDSKGTKFKVADGNDALWLHTEL
jgi:hypothetical protein